MSDQLTVDMILNARSTLLEELEKAGMTAERYVIVSIDPCHFCDSIIAIQDVDDPTKCPRCGVTVPPGVRYRIPVGSIKRKR